DVFRDRGGGQRVAGPHARTARGPQGRGLSPRDPEGEVARIWRAETVRDGTVHATLVPLDRQRRTGEPAPRRRIAPPDRRAGCRRLARHAVPVSRRFRLCPAPGEGTLQSAHPAKWSGGL